MPKNEGLVKKQETIIDDELDGEPGKKEEGEMKFEAGKENAAEKTQAKPLVDSEIAGNDTEGIADDLGK